jgi:hypothetical protein
MKKKPEEEDPIDEIDDHLEHLEAILDLLYRASTQDPPFREGTLSTIADDGLEHLDRVKDLIVELYSREKKPEATLK